MTIDLTKHKPVIKEEKKPNIVFEKDEHCPGPECGIWYEYDQFGSKTIISAGVQV